MARCLRSHEHRDAGERDACNAQLHDSMSLIKMAQVGFAGPAKIPRVYRPARTEQRSGLRVFVFSEEQIIPWQLDDDADEDD
jgi:hypothetical protein